MHESAKSADAASVAPAFLLRSKLDPATAASEATAAFDADALKSDLLDGF